MIEVTQSIDAEALALLCNLEWLEYDGRPYPAALEILRNHRETAHAAGLAAGIAQERERCAGVAEGYPSSLQDMGACEAARAIAAAIRSET